MQWSWEVRIGIEIWIWLIAQAKWTGRMQSHLRPQCGLQWQSAAVHVFALWLHREKKNKSTFPLFNPLFMRYLIQNGHGQWVNETKGFVSLCIWQFSMTMHSFRLIGQTIREKNDGDRQIFLHYLVRLLVRCKWDTKKTEDAHVLLLSHIF